ncbi:MULTISPECIES: hypothetical protein [unclassified Paenibacillus]|uniref:hypothetical protein n=1 Tax=unclassified Paenibacillus TaxID=185978 RepID=UPI0036D33C40
MMAGWVVWIAGISIITFVVALIVGYENLCKLSIIVVIACIVAGIANAFCPFDGKSRKSQLKAILFVTLPAILCFLWEYYTIFILGWEIGRR